jgi:hypothetical protein
MRSMLKIIALIAILLIPRMSFSWEESKHPISELLIHHIHIDTNYVLCGSDASWGSNVFGLFVFDRRTESWTNHTAREKSRIQRPLRNVKQIKKDGDFVLVTFHGGVALKFNTRDGSYEQTEGKHIPFIRDFPLNIDGVEYRIHCDSVIVQKGSDTEFHVATLEQALKVRSYPYEPEPPNPILSYPVHHKGRIYMPFDFYGDVMNISTKGLAVFDIEEKTFSFYPSDIFQGTVMGGFVNGSLVVFYTAKTPYEANAHPAAGFVAFDPAKLIFSLWEELPLPDIPLAIFDVAQDHSEYWIGTDKGVFRIDKKSNKSTHSQITKAAVAKEEAFICVTQDGYVATKLGEGHEVKPLAVWNGWCEIKSPRHIAGFVEGKFVEGVALSKHGNENICRFKPLDQRDRIPVRVSDDPDAEVMVRLDVNSLEEYEYKMVATVAKQGKPTWYQIELPTVWINMDDLVFQLGKVD